VDSLGARAGEDPTYPVGAGNAFGSVMCIIGVRFGDCERKRTRRSWRSQLGWPWSGGSGCVVVLVDESVAGGVSSDRLAGPVRDDHAVVGGALLERPVGAVGVLVLEVVAEELFELSAVPDEGAIEQFAAHRADPSFRVSVGDGCVRRCANDRRGAASEDFVESSDELAGARRQSRTVVHLG
jgi:hypothetical protein